MSDANPPPEGAQETFISHLIELRSRLLRSIVAVIVVLLGLFPFAKQIYAALAAPLLRVLPTGATMIATDVTGTFLVPLKVTLMTAFMVALPYVLWQIWAFVAPGLYQSERRLALPVLVSSFVCFVAGMSEPAKNQRISLGLIALLYFGLLFVFAYWLKREYWKDVH